jgi:hypothetical protein
MAASSGFVINSRPLERLRRGIKQSRTTKTLRKALGNEVIIEPIKEEEEAICGRHDENKRRKGKSILLAVKTSLNVPAKWLFLLNTVFSLRW